MLSPMATFLCHEWDVEAKKVPSSAKTVYLRSLRFSSSSALSFPVSARRRSVELRLGTQPNEHRLKQMPHRQQPRRERSFGSSDKVFVLIPKALSESLQCVCPIIAERVYE